MASGVHQRVLINKYALVARSIFLFPSTISTIYTGGLYGCTICHRRFKFQSVLPYIIRVRARKRGTIRNRERNPRRKRFSHTHTRKCSDVISARYKRTTAKGRR